MVETGRSEAIAALEADLLDECAEFTEALVDAAVLVAQRAGKAIDRDALRAAFDEITKPQQLAARLAREAFCDG